MHSFDGWHVPLIGKFSDHPVTLFSLSMEPGLFSAASNFLVFFISFCTRASSPIALSRFLIIVNNGPPNKEKTHIQSVYFLHHMGLFRWVARKLMSIMGNLYVWLDKRVEYTKEEVSDVLGLRIDSDLQTSSRYELCRIVEKEFKLPQDSFWSLHSTQKIRFATQQIREMKKPRKMEMGS